MLRKGSSTIGEFSPDTQRANQVHPDGSPSSPMRRANTSAVGSKLYLSSDTRLAKTGARSASIATDAVRSKQRSDSDLIGSGDLLQDNSLRRRRAVTGEDDVRSEEGWETTSDDDVQPTSAGRVNGSTSGSKRSLTASQVNILWSNDDLFGIEDTAYEEEEDATSQQVKEEIVDLAAEPTLDAQRVSEVRLSTHAIFNTLPF